MNAPPTPRRAFSGVRGWGYTGEMGTICLLAFFPCFIVLFASKLAISSLKRSVLGAWEGHVRARKGQMVNSGFQDNKGKRHNTTTGLGTWIAPNWAKKCYKIGEKNAKRTNGTYFARPRGVGVHKLWDKFGSAFMFSLLLLLLLLLLLFLLSCSPRHESWQKRKSSLFG